MPLLAVQDIRSPTIVKVEYTSWAGEVVAFCPRCKAFQTVWISEDKLTPTRKFFQEGS